jgi:hypothetical protein
MTATPSHVWLTAESELLYNWFIANQIILVPSPLRITTRALFFFFLQLNPSGHSPYATSSLMRRWVCLLWTCLAFVKCTYCTYSMSLKLLTCAVHTSSLCQYRLCKASMSILVILCYNGSLVTWRVVSLTAAKFKPLIFSMSGFTLFYAANMLAKYFLMAHTI